MNQDKLDTSFLETKEEISLSGQGFTDALQAVLDRGAAFRFQAKGFSMSPFIKDGDILTISPFNNGPVRLGQTIAFLHPGNGKLTIHRIIGISRYRYFLKGDNIFGVDGWVDRECLLGAVSRVQRNSKSLTLSLGWERVIIAFFSRTKLFPLILWGWRWGKQLWQHKN